jgi:ribonuclease HI
MEEWRRKMEWILNILEQQEHYWGIIRMYEEESYTRLEIGGPRNKDGTYASHSDTLQNNCYIVIKGNLDLPQGAYATLESDASYKDGATGMGYVLEYKGKSYKPREHPHTKLHGPNVAELKSVVKGLKEITKQGCKHVLIKTDNQWVISVLGGLSKPQKNHTITVTKEAFEAMDAYETIHIKHVKGGIKEADKASKRARTKAEGKLKNARMARIKKMETIMRRTVQVDIKTIEGGFLAQGQYFVTINPPSCTCPAWDLRWQGKELSAKRAQRLPCKHIAAAAEQEGYVIEDLVDLGKKAIE